jgi:hypothetical protein
VIQVTEYQDGLVYDIDDLDTGRQYRNVALVDLPDLLIELGVEPNAKPLTPEEVRWLKALDYYARYPTSYPLNDPDLQVLLNNMHQMLAESLFRNFIKKHPPKRSPLAAKVAFEAATHRYAGGETRIRELIKEVGYEIIGDCVRANT